MSEENFNKIMSYIENDIREEDMRQSIPLKIKLTVTFRFLLFYFR